MHKLSLLLLLFVFTSHLPAADISLSLEDATKIAKQKIKEDTLPEDHLVIRLIDFIKDRPKFFLVSFDPHIPDPSANKDNVFVAYDIEMDGTIKRSHLTEERHRVTVPFRAESWTRTSQPDFLNTPLHINISTGRQSTHVPFLPLVQ